MNKVFFYFSALLALASCSSDGPSDKIIDPVDQTRTLSFNVSTFEQSIIPMADATRATGGGKTEVVYAVYKETGEYVKTKISLEPYAEVPNIALKDTLPSGKYKICIGLQYTQSNTAQAQPELKKAFANASINYSSDNAYFYETYAVDLTPQGNKAITAKLPRITGAAEIFITDIDKATSSDKNIKIGAFNMPKAFNVSTKLATGTTYNTFSATFPLTYFTANNAFYADNSYLKSTILPFPAAYVGAFNANGNPVNSAPETYYRYIHSIPTTGMYFEMTLTGAATKKVSGFEIKKNQRTLIKGEIEALRNAETNISIDKTWGADLNAMY